MASGDFYSVGSGYSRSGGLGWNYATTNSATSYTFPTIPASTPYPCGHLVQYIGNPPAACPSCGQKHTWASDSSAPLSKAWSVQMNEGVQANMTPPESKEPTLVEWLEDEVNAVCGLAFAA